ncbi:MAG: 16S rRNA (uracil(1498)-N(3))-methyltransferase, partial [Bacteroidetes bacterium]|nr:16S rRNA (uracil(1498)-N(3))-methyltransferase [Bacteroidota bacterium]
MNLFYAPDISGDTYILDYQESIHCTRVLRNKKGDFIKLTDGKGNLYTAEIVNEDNKICQV